MAQHSYLAKLFQVQRSLTDSYTIEADTEEQARTQAEQIAKDKGLKDYEFEIEDLSAKASNGANPEQPGENTDQPTDKPAEEAPSDGGQQNDKQ